MSNFEKRGSERICTETIRYDTIEVFNVDSKAEYSVVHVARN